MRRSDCRTGRFASSVAAALALAGCSSVAGLRHDAKAPATTPSADVVQAAQLNSYANALSQLVQGSPAEQAELIAGARAAYDPARAGPGALRYGLMLAAPNHPAHDAPQAQRLLREALSRPELLSVTERALAIVELQRVESELRATAEVDRLTAELQRERERQRNTVTSATVAKRLQTEMDENARLRKALDEARAKLDAIANIERSISDRPPAKEGRTQ
jgi:cell division septum initiation protein DivIVA